VSHSPNRVVYNDAVDLSGVLNPIPTPFDGNGDVDLARLRAAIGRWLATRLSGFVVLGSTGEAALLDEVESERVIACARDAVPSSRTFIVGTGRESTRAAVSATRRAAALGADAVLVRNPSFYKAQMNAAAHVSHYTAVADASPVPVLLYNFTAVTGVTIPVEAVAALASHPNVAGMKESNGDVPRLAQLVAAVPRTFSVVTGSASTLYEALGAGAAGGILALSALLPDACVELVELARAGRHGEARALQDRLTPVAKLFGAAYGIAGLKAALNLIGYDVGTPRAPLAPLAEDGVREVIGKLALFPETSVHVAS
jgi:4-hydroxy-2-oxoglutarate aldolase